MAQASDFSDFGWQLSIDFPQRTEKQSPGLPIWKAGALFMWLSGLGPAWRLLPAAQGSQAHSKEARSREAHGMPLKALRRPQERF